MWPASDLVLGVQYILFQGGRSPARNYHLHSSLNNPGNLHIRLTVALPE